MLQKNKVFIFFRELITDTLKTVLLLFKIMIPVSIGIKILQETGMISYIGDALFPLMKCAGLPGEMGLVWGTGMITNLFGGILAFISLAPSMHLTIAQVTVLSLMMLVAHTFPIELTVARKAGVRLLVMFLIRFGFGFLLGVLLNFIYSSFGMLQETVAMKLIPKASLHPTLLAWGLAELRNYGIIICIIFSLMFLIKLLKVIGVIDFITRGFAPVLRMLGIGKEVSTIAIVGLSLGVVYGGALIIHESETGKIDKRDIFYMMVLMGLCHSVIEDTILMMSLGADYTGVLIFRVILALLITYTIVKITKRLPERFVNRFIIRK